MKHFWVIYFGSRQDVMKVQVTYRFEMSSFLQEAFKRMSGFFSIIHLKSRKYLWECSSTLWTECVSKAKTLPLIHRSTDCIFPAGSELVNKCSAQLCSHLHSSNIMKAVKNMTIQLTFFQTLHHTSNSYDCQMQLFSFCFPRLPSFYFY